MVTLYYLKTLLITKDIRVKALFYTNSCISKGELVRMLYLIKHSVFICLYFWVLEHINVISILPFFVFLIYISLYNIIKNKKGLAVVYTICKHKDLECILAFVLAILRLFKLYSSSSFFIIRS
jgi:hypothetical protein